MDIAARIITLYPVDPRPVSPSGHDESASLFGVTPRDGKSEFADSPWRPIITGVRSWDPDEYGAPHAGTAYRVTAVTTAVARMAGDVEVLLLDLTVTAPLDGIILAERDAYDPAVEIKIGTSTLAPAVLGDDARLEAAAARQQILLLPGGPGALFASGDPDDLPVSRAGELRKLLIKDTAIGYRPAQMAVRVPPDINGPDRQAVYVWATNTVAEGLDQYGELGRLRVLGMVLSNCQTIAATMAARTTRAAALEELDAPAPAEDEDAETLRDRAELRIRRVARLRHDLNRNAETHARGTAVVGGRPMLSYHQAVVAESDLPTLLAATQHLLEQLSASLAVEQQLRSVQEARETADQQLAVARSTQGLLNQSEALKAASVIFASVAAVLALAGLFAQAAAIPGAQDGTYFRSLPGSVVFVLAVALFAVIVGVAVRMASRRSVPPRLRPAARIGRWSLIAITSLGIIASAAGVLVPVGVAVAGTGAVLLILLVAAEFEYEKA
ncbi:hypothetical protein [Paractinoplanes globisporus]|uniref:Uncharacterized protein n=1 Tax=Paractinoplanes globisporus TaxID=113565 RepID=A0ABW6WNB4_9ACTN|nr:hypothetical protein [Actinoplanes globisporus]